MIDTLNKASFDPLINEKFLVRPMGMEEWFEIELVTTTEKNTDFSEGFSLFFRAPAGFVVRHDSHTVKHPRLGEFTLFMGPVIYPKTDGVYYGAVFNRLKG